MWAGTGEREVRHKITFDTEFIDSPSIQISITLMDADTNQHLRYSINSENITVSAFEIVFKTWSDSRFARLWVNWMAIGERRDPKMWDV